jgi:uncharacterized protein YndB with AHSA1/START domain
MSTKIEITHRYDHAIDRVWEAITDKRAISQWLMATTDFEPRVGCRFRLTAKPQPGWRGFVECEVVELEAPRRLAYSWVGNEGQKPMQVTFSLEPDGGGTRLTFVQTGFEGLGGFLLAKLMMGPGWRKMFRKRLVAVLGDAGLLRHAPA